MASPDSVRLDFGINNSTAGDDIQNFGNGTLYVKGQPSDEFFLILQGKVIVESGAEGFIV